MCWRSSGRFCFRPQMTRVDVFLILFIVYLLVLGDLIFNGYGGGIKWWWRGEEVEI